METAQVTLPKTEVQINLPTPWRHLFPITGSGFDEKLYVKITPTLILEVKIWNWG
jgi:hypothetical protein